MKLTTAGVLLALGAALALVVVGQPDAEKRLSRIEPGLDRRILNREVQIDPAELLEMMNDSTPLRIVDVRGEADFNLFHLMDAQRADMGQVRDPTWAKTLPPATVIVLVSNDEKSATEAWKRLSARKVMNLYILEGGINHWLNLYGGQEHASRMGRPASDPRGDDTLRYAFSLALGSRHPAAAPDMEDVPAREYRKKVKSPTGAARKSGGCS